MVARISASVSPAQHHAVLSAPTPILFGAQHPMVARSRARIAHRMGQAAHGLHILRKHVQSRIETVRTSRITLEIRRQSLHRGAGIALLMARIAAA